MKVGILTSRIQSLGTSANPSYVRFGRTFNRDCGTLDIDCELGKPAQGQSF